MDEVIRLIRSSPDPATARQKLLERDWPASDVMDLIGLIDDPRHQINDDGTFKLSDEQARAILALTLSRLTALGRNEIGDELNSLGEQIKDYLDILRSRERVLGIIRDELNEIKDQYATPRMTQIDEFAGDLDDEDLIAREDMVVTVSHAGYIKRVPLSTYRAQRRGGKGRSGMSTRDEDFVARLFVANTHTPVLFFSSRGIVYKMKVWRLPVAAPQARGKALINMLPLEDGERITSIMPLPEDEDSWASLDVMFVTQSGNVRRNKLSDFVEVRQNGKIAMKLDEGDGIVGVETASESDDILITTAKGQCIRFAITDVRVFKGRDSTGVRGINLAKGDEVIAMSILRHFDASAEERAAYLKMSRAVRGEADENAEVAEAVEVDEEVAGDAPLDQDRYASMSAAEQFVLTISEKGFGKRTSSFEYRVTGRGGKGIVAMAVNSRNGSLVGSFPVEDENQLMLVTNGGQVIRVPVDGIRIVGRSSQGVTIFRTATDEKVVSVERITEPESAEGEEPEDGAEAPPSDE